MFSIDSTTMLLWSRPNASIILTQIYGKKVSAVIQICDMMNKLATAGILYPYLCPLIQVLCAN